MVRTPTTAFNSGGTPYDISCSLLARYPDSLLSRLVSAEWQDGSSEPVFVERGATIFAQVLTYM